MKRLSFILGLLLAALCRDAAMAQTPLMASYEQWAQPIAGGAATPHGSCGTFTHDLFIRAATSDATNTMTLGGWDVSLDKLFVVNVAASNNAPITVWDSSSNLWIAAKPVTNGNIVDQQFFCTNTIATNNDQFFAKADGCSPVIQVNTFECTGTPIFDSQSIGGGGSGATTYQPGSIAPFSGNELFTLGGAMDIVASTFTVDSSFAAGAIDTSGNISAAGAYKISGVAENPTVTVDNTTEHVSLSMLMFGSVNCSGGSQPTGATFDWRLNGDLTDSSGNGNSGTLAAGTASYTTDEHGNATHAITFAGTSANTVVAMNNATAANVTSGDMTIYVKIKFTGSGFTDNGGQIQNIFTKGSFQVAGYTCDVHAALGGDTLAGHIEFASEQSGADQVIATSDRAVVLNTWYDLVIVKSGTTVTLSVYNSGTLVEPAATGTIVNPTSDTTDAFTIGGASGQLQAVVAQTAQWPFAFTGTQITTLVNPTTGGSL